MSKKSPATQRIFVNQKQGALPAKLKSAGRKVTLGSGVAGEALLFLEGGSMYGC